MRLSEHCIRLSEILLGLSGGTLNGVIRTLNEIFILKIFVFIRIFDGTFNLGNNLEKLWIFYLKYIIMD